MEVICLKSHYNVGFGECMNETFGLKRPDVDFYNGCSTVLVSKRNFVVSSYFSRKGYTNK